jgi:cold shock CspA family protein
MATGTVKWFNETKGYGSGISRQFEGSEGARAVFAN